MNHIKIMTDSTCDLNEDIIKLNNISIIPLYVSFNETSYKDGEDLNPAQLFKKVQEMNIIPKTSSPPPLNYYKAFNQYIKEGENILFISLSSKISSSYDNAVFASKEFDQGRIEIIDSENLSTGVGLLVLKAVDFMNKGMGFHDIAVKIRELTPKVRVSFIIDTFEYLYKGGRCNSIASFMGEVLKIKPIISIVNGKAILAQKLIGRKKALDCMLENALKYSENIDLTRISITHSFAEEDANYLKLKLEERLKVKEILINTAGCVISSHCGKNTIGILYIIK